MLPRISFTSNHSRFRIVCSARLIAPSMACYKPSWEEHTNSTILYVWSVMSLLLVRLFCPPVSGLYAHRPCFELRHDLFGEPAQLLPELGLHGTHWPSNQCVLQTRVLVLHLLEVVDGLLGDAGEPGPGGLNRCVWGLSTESHWWRYLTLRAIICGAGPSGPGCIFPVSVSSATDRRKRYGNRGLHRLG